MTAAGGEANLGGSPAAPSGRGPAIRFVLIVGVLSFFADFTYEGARGITGPWLAMLGASASVVAIVSGTGELFGYGLRLVSGRLADATGRFWLITIFGYVLQMSVVPLLAFTTSWPAAATLIILERTGKAIRNPPRDVMLSYAAQEAGGYGWAFGMHEAMDQFGAMVGPLLVAAVLAHGGSYRLAFTVLAAPAAINLALVLAARLLFPNPRSLDKEPQDAIAAGILPTRFWLYLAGGCLVAAGYADYPLIAYHLSRSGGLFGTWTSILYAIAMGVSGAGSLLFGRMFDRFGLRVLIGLTLVSAGFAPLLFLADGFGPAIAGAVLWGLGMGVHETIIPAAVAPMVPRDRRASAFGLFTGAYGVAWFSGSAAMGLLYTRSPAALVGFCVLLQLVAVPFFLATARSSPGACTHPS